MNATTTFKKTKKLQTVHTAGFTLIEMMVVVAIIALISIVAMPNITSYFQLSLNSATRDIATTVKETYNSAIVTGKMHRIAYDLEKNEYWAEVGPATLLLETKESLEKEKTKKKWGSLKDNDKVKPSGFQLEKTITRKKIALPRGVTFEDIISEQSKEEITEGLAYTHFFPHGITEQTIIHLKDQSKHKATLVINSLIGMTDLYDRYVDVKDVFKEK